MSPTPDFFPRLIEPRIREAMADTPVVLIAGPRQSGKTTLVHRFANDDREYLTLDDELTVLSAREDPVGLLRSRGPVIIDEIQRAPELLPAVKRLVDTDRQPGRFLLTGSANLMAIPTVSESLAGRMEVLRLLPLSQSELHYNGANWIDAAFSGNLLRQHAPEIDEDLTAAVLKGGYPEAVSREVDRRRTAWFRQYLDALIQRDIRDVGEIDKLDSMRSLLRASAHTAGQLTNYSDLAAVSDLNHKSVGRYLGILEHMFLLRRLPPFASNRLKRLVKTPKIEFYDSGVLATLTDVTADEAKSDRTRFGPVLESFVYSELAKHVSTAQGDYGLYFYRDRDGVEVDFVIESAAGSIVGVEVKAKATVRSEDLRGLQRLAGRLGPRFFHGVVLYNGTETIPLGNNLWAAPIAGLWGESGTTIV